MMSLSWISGVVITSFLFVSQYGVLKGALLHDQLGEREKRIKYCNRLIFLRILLIVATKFNFFFIMDNIWTVVTCEDYCLTRDGLKYCINNCCGPYADQVCCAFNPTVLVLMVVAIALAIVVLTILIILCCKATKRRRATGVQSDIHRGVPPREDRHQTMKTSSVTYVVVPPGESTLFLQNLSTLPPYTPEPPKYSESSFSATGTGQLHSVWPLPGTSRARTVMQPSAPPSYASNPASISVEPDLSSNSETPIRQK